MKEVAVLKFYSAPAFPAPQNNLLLFSAGLALNYAVLQELKDN